MSRTPWTLVGPLAVLTAVEQLEIFTSPLPGPRVLLVVTSAVASLALLAARRTPLAAVGVSFGALAVMAVVARAATVEATAPLFAGLGAAFLVARHGRRDEALAGLAMFGAVLLIVSLDQPTVATGVTTFLVTGVLGGVTWGTGFSLRARDERASDAEARADQAELERELAVAEERARIARDLHDIVAHSVSVMVLQTGVVRHNLPSGRDEDRNVLLAVERTGRAALTEMRQLLGAMRSDRDPADRAPQPSLAGVPVLIEDVVRAGLPARLDVQGDPRPLPQGIELSAYRIVQEGLTNALKHAHAKQVDVRLTYSADALGIEVRDDGDGPANGTDGLGHGLIGVAERVKVVGGEMAAGRAPEGGFVLSSRLPV